MRDKIFSLAENLTPFDELEAKHRLKALEWIDSGQELCRTQKPATPDPHLVAYFVLFDLSASKLLLVDHKKAQLWLPSGGHVEPREYPKETVRRECLEELALKADFLFADPIFLTMTETAGTTVRHTDVSFWYVLHADSTIPITFDRGEFFEVRWFALDKIPAERTDPYLDRFIKKLNSLLSKDGYSHAGPFDKR